MKLITLLTDFTERDGYVGVMKGVILGIAPDAVIVDLSHDIPPQDVMQAALLLGRSAPFFPEGSVHVCVVDPGVGTTRRGIIARLGGQFFIGPDNGLMTLLYNRALQDGGSVEVYRLENREYQLSPLSHTFHGRDVFAPASAHLVNGIALENFGQPANDPVMLQFPEPLKTKDGWHGQVIHIDAFGNLACNLSVGQLANLSAPNIRIKDQMIQTIKLTFGEGKPGELIAVIDSFGSLSLSVVNGSAAKSLGAKVGDSVYVVND